VVPEEILPAGGGEVLVMVRRRARTRGTDTPADRLAAQLWTLRDGRVLRIRSFSDVAEARREAGLG
jgi:ketosteroid isomerase-like protein